MRILCVHCRQALYDYDGDFEGRPRLERFHPIADAPVPERGKTLICHKCQNPWYMVRYENGALVLMTSEGWKPREPSDRSVLSYSEATRGISRAEYADADYKDPREVAKKRSSEYTKGTGRSP